MELYFKWIKQHLHIKSFYGTSGKEFDELAVSGREPTPVEQLDLLAGLCERGFVTCEEFEQAKVRLLGKI